MIHFVWPLAFVLLPAPLAAWWLLPPWHERRDAVRIPFYDELAALMGPSVRLNMALTRGWPAIACAALVWILMVAGLARPQVQLPPIERQVPARDLILALDLSRSMDARDFTDASGNHIDRFTAVRRIVEDFIRRRKGDRIGLIVFGDQAFVQMPLTLDHAALIESLRETRTGMAGDATAIGDAVLLGVKLFEKHADTSKTMILLTDGDDTASRAPPQNIAPLARDRGVHIYTVGMSAGMSASDSQSQFTTLRQIASVTKAQFFSASDGAGLARIYATLDAIEPSKVKVLSVPRHADIAWVCAASALVVVLLWHGAALVTALWRRRTVPGEEPA